MGQPYNIVISVCLRGNIPWNNLDLALEKLQKKHPLLRAQILLDLQDIPHFIWKNVNKIPYQIIDRKDDDHYLKMVQAKFLQIYEMGENCEDPLIDLTILKAGVKCDFIFAMPHVIADGMSISYLFRDFLRFLYNPLEEINELSLPITIENILPKRIARKIPKTALRVKLIYFGLQIILKCRGFYRRIFKRQQKSPNMKPSQINQEYKLYSWKLTEEETTRLLQLCKKHGIKVHSAICTMFLQDFPSINTAVNVRNRLEHAIGEEIGLFTGSIVQKMKYDQNQTFWENAKRYQARLSKNLESDKIFSIYKIFSRAVPVTLITKISSAFLEFQGKSLPLVITNIGVLDQFSHTAGMKGIQLERYFGGISGSYDVLLVTTYSVNQQLHFTFSYYKPSHSTEEIRMYVDNAMRALNNALI